MNTWQKLRNNPSLWEQYFIRERVIKATRAFFDTQQFHEVDTPILIPSPAAESYVDVFKTSLLDRNRHPTPAYLSTSPELALKKLMVAGIGNCYSITKSFRNTETDSKTHMPEFTILEWYRVNTLYETIMEDCKALVQKIHYDLFRKNTLTYQGITFHLEKDWEQISVRDAFERYANIRLDDFFDMKNARTIAKKKGYTVEKHSTWEQLYNQIFINEIEPHLGKSVPTIIYGFPGSMAALAKKDDKNPNYAKRFEFYIGGLELGDCYEELTDWKEQLSRFEAELAKVKRLNKTPYEYDHDFILALKTGMPEASGIAVGLDRLIMLMGNMADINDTSFFPTNILFEKK